MHGILTALATPFRELGDDVGDLDLEAFERAVDRQLAAGIHGLVPCGTTGETPTLSAEEQDELVRVTVARARASGRAVPVVAGIGSNDTRATVRRAEQVAALGADAGLLVFPYYNKPNAEGLRRHVRAVASVGLPLVLYHVPSRTGQHLPSALVAELSSAPGVVALKEATGDVRYGTDVIARTATPVLSGDDFSFLALLAQGGAGCVSVVSNVDPARTVAVHDRFVAGDAAGARAVLRELWDLVAFLFADSNPVPCKAALAELGLGSARPRLPLAPWSGPSPRPLLAALGLV
jgi:4-hydroxy-tetrahydrodipicolinate synthase